MGLSALKYGILDLTFHCDDVVWEAEDAARLDVLKECHFVVSPAGPGEDVVAGEQDPACLTELRDDILKKETLLKLFLRRKSEDGRKAGVLGSFVPDGRIQSAGVNAGGMEKRIDELFPSDFVVADACLTNAGFIWFHKHFYL